MSETWHPGMPLGYVDSIITGDAWELIQEVPDNSIDLIFTDPVYDDFDAYSDLARWASRVLKSKGALLVWVATSRAADVMDEMLWMSDVVGLLQYRWTLHWQRYGPPSPGATGICVITQCLWLDKNGSSRPRYKLADWMSHPQGGIRDNRHPWSKPLPVVTKWLDAFTEPGQVVLDPFCGGGTVPVACKQLQRHYVAFEIDPETAVMARQRVDNTQLPLLLPEPIQAELWEKEEQC